MVKVLLLGYKNLIYSFNLKEQVLFCVFSEAGEVSGTLIQLKFRGKIILEAFLFKINFGIANIKFPL
jgi:hypothetical protein